MADFDYNRDVARRDLLVFGHEIDWERGVPGGISSFSGMTGEKLDQLIEERFIKPHGSQNNSPTAEEFLEFIEEHPQFTAHGYAVSPKRSDYRVTIEGIAYSGPGAKALAQDPEKLREHFELLKAFVLFCRHADELVVEDDRFYAWWD